MTLASLATISVNASWTWARLLGKSSMLNVAKRSGCVGALLHEQRSPNERLATHATTSHPSDVDDRRRGSYASSLRMFAMTSA
jgi:hypothetical protein